MDDTKYRVVKELIKEANKALEAHEFLKADLFCDEALRFSDKFFLPYLIKVLAQNKVTEIEDLKNCDFDFNSDSFIKLRTYADKQLNEELDSHLSKLQGFVDYRKYKEYKDRDERLGNVVDDNSDATGNEEYYETYESGNVVDDNFDSAGNEEYSGSYESGNAEADDNSQDILKESINEVIKKIEYAGGISKIEEENNGNTENNNYLLKKDEKEKNLDESITGNNEYVNNEYVKSEKENLDEENLDEEKLDEEYSTEAEYDQREENNDEIIYPYENISLNTPVKTFLLSSLNVLFDIYPKKVQIKMNTSEGQIAVKEGESFASTCTVFSFFILLPLFLLNILLIMSFFLNKWWGTCIGLLTGILFLIRLARIYKLNLMLYIRQKNINKYTGFQYFTRIIVNIIMFFLYGALIYLSYGYVAYILMEEENHPYALIALFLGILGQKFVYYFYRNNFNFNINLSGFFGRLFK